MPTYHKRNKVGILDLSIPVVNKKQKKTNKEIYNKNDNANMAESKNKSTKGKSISFLLGAGFSAPKGYPIGNQLNEKLLTCTGDNFAFSPSGTLVVNNDGTKPDLGYKNQYDIYFDFCTDLIRYYNDNIKSFDYEEFYDYLKNDAHKDPALVAFFKAKKYNGGKAKLNDYLFQIDNIFNQLISFYLEDKDGKNRHNDEAFHMKPYFDGYTGFINCIETFLKEFIVDVHTLNHDLFFERLDRTEWINGELCDGFEELGSPYYGTLLYDNRSYKCRLERYTGNYDTKLTLYKLHGSIDYYLYSRTEGTTFIPETYIKRKWGIGSSDFYKEIKDKDGNLVYENCWINYHSDFLTGTTSKIIRYREPLLYQKLFKLFEDNLEQADMLIIIGYGCKDLEVNKIIMEKFGKDKPCFIVDPYAGDTVKDFIKEMGDNTKLISKSLDSLQIADFIKL